MVLLTHSTVHLQALQKALHKALVRQAGGVATVAAAALAAMRVGVALLAVAVSSAPPSLLPTLLLDWRRVPPEMGGKTVIVTGTTTLACGQCLRSTQRAVQAQVPRPVHCGVCGRACSSLCASPLCDDRPATGPQPSKWAYRFGGASSWSSGPVSPSAATVAAAAVAGSTSVATAVAGLASAAAAGIVPSAASGPSAVIVSSSAAASVAVSATSALASVGVRTGRQPDAEVSSYAAGIVRMCIDDPCTHTPPALYLELLRRLAHLGLGVRDGVRLGSRGPTRQSSSGRACRCAMQDDGEPAPRTCETPRETLGQGEPEA